MKVILTFAAILFLISCADKRSDESSNVIDTPVMPPTQLNAAFLIVDGVYNSELIAPMDVLHHTVFHSDKGIKVFTVAPVKDTITSFEGLKIIPDFSFRTDSLPRIDILVVPSAKNSMGSDLENKELIEFVQKSGKQASYIMSLCDGAFVLAKAGLLDTYECTTFPGDIDKFKKAYPSLKVHEGISFVHDRKAITSAGGAKSYDPALYLVELLYGKPAAEGIGKGLVIDWKLSDVKSVRTHH